MRGGQRKGSFWRIEHFKNCGRPDPSKAQSPLTQLSGRHRKAVLQEGGRLGFLRTSCLGFALIAGLGNLPVVWKLSENSQVLVSFENLKRTKFVFLKQQQSKKQNQQTTNKLAALNYLHNFRYNLKYFPLLGPGVPVREHEDMISLVWLIFKCTEFNLF